MVSSPPHTEPWLWRGARTGMPAPEWANRKCTVHEQVPEAWQLKGTNALSTATALPLLNSSIKTEPSEATALGFVAVPVALARPVTGSADTVPEPVRAMPYRAS